MKRKIGLILSIMLIVSCENNNATNSNYEADNMIFILQQSVERGMKIDPLEAQNRFRTIRQKLKFVTDRVTAS